MPVSRRLSKRARAWLDAFAYAVAVAVAVTSGALALGLATGGGFVRGKVLAFAAGWLLVGYATVRLWPTSVDDLDGPSVSSRGTRLEGLVRAVPPLRWIRLPAPPERVRVAGKVFLAGVVTLAGSLVMETAFGVV
ncbi:hypothetical protein C471_10310 [Halorubrum saccharovorum DSM 1137]|uniref:Uncharacterized protein n=1 Tax=Halorubrum saccharovorum DSM 1137 TaxID=1227484 RepID=M0DS63_9EURY|nr:hypothetical protein [Halorubrum saccharovorum]ELZ38346.1 hypothetical protein C471_10310 [Halorubrum saccharovorum DSM 1137]